MLKPQIIYSGIGVYVPQITPSGVVWKRDTGGNPLVGANVEGILSVSKWAEIVKIELPKEEGIPQ